jgi:hypothetical protein
MTHYNTNIPCSSPLSFLDNFSYMKQVDRHVDRVNIEYNKAQFKL